MALGEDVNAIGRWLANNSPGFLEISNDVKVGMSYYVMVWSLFDYRFLHASGRLIDVQGIIESRDFSELDAQDLMPHFEYFRRRYLDGRKRNHHLDLLVWNDYQSGDHIASYLAQIDPTHREIAGALLLISYRLRCNLVHGSKWESGLADQYDNFSHATKAMMTLMDYLNNP